MGRSHKSNIAMARRKTGYEGFVSAHGPKHNHGDFNTAKCNDKSDGGKTKQQEWLRKDPQNDSVEHGETKQRKDQKVDACEFMAIGVETRVTEPHSQNHCEQRRTADHNEQVSAENKAINGDDSPSNPTYQIGAVNG